MNLYDELSWRGQIHQVTDDTLARGALDAGDGGIRAYIGFDPSADSLHVGSLVPILALRRLQVAGHTPIVLVGGATGLIGDPSGKSEERNLISRERAEANAAALTRQLAHFVNFDGPNAAITVDNLGWHGQLHLLDFLRDIGKFFSVNAMIQRDSVRNRLDRDNTGISFTEFAYMLLQAYDFYHLYKEFGCRAQLGGSDQWGNIVSGIDLIRGHGLGADAPPFGLTMPLVTSRSGAKFGKTEAGAVWLDAARTSPYAFYQFWFNSDDEDLGRWLRTFTFLGREEIEAVEVQHGASPHQREGQRRLAEELTVLVHGKDGLAAAQRATAVLFGGERGDLSAAELVRIFHDGGVAQTRVDPQTGGGISLKALLVGDSPGHAFASGSLAKQALKSGSVSVNGAKVGPGIGDVLAADQLIEGRLAIVRVGRKQRFLVRVEGDA